MPNKDNKTEEKKCTGAHCKCMDIGGQCSNMHWYHCKEHNPNATKKGGGADEVKDTSLEDWSERFEEEFGSSDGQDFFGEGQRISRVKSFISKEIKATEQKVRGEIVICAAIRMNDGYIIRGHRHCDCLLTASKIPRYKKDSHAFGNNQGFVTSKNRYVDRIEGAKIQKVAGIKSKMPEGQEYLHGELYSEDLY